MLKKICEYANCSFTLIYRFLIAETCDKILKMDIKKTNAKLSLITIFLLAVHSIYQIVSYIIFYYNPLLSKLFGYSVAAVILLHIILSVISVFALHDSKTVSYSKLNARILTQRISAVIMCILLPIHICLFDLLKKTAGTTLYALLEATQVLFFASLFLHISISFSNALVTLGILEDMKKKKIIDVLVSVI